jgi:hypothetical protein
VAVLSLLVFVRSVVVRLDSLERTGFGVLLWHPFMVLSLFFTGDAGMSGLDVVINSEIGNHVIHWMLNFEGEAIKLLLATLMPWNLFHSRSES